MSTELTECIAATQKELGAIISKPKLTEKLLVKPPFRFLHDVISSVISTTGFGEGLYSKDELDSDLVKERGPKMAFLDKMIVCVGLCRQEPLDVKSSKIVTGQEPEKTNKFLLALARVSSNKALDWNSAVINTLKSYNNSEKSADTRKRSAIAEAKDTVQSNREDSKLSRDVAEDKFGFSETNFENRKNERSLLARPSRGSATVEVRGEFKAGIENMVAMPVITTEQFTKSSDLSPKIEACTGDIEVTIDMIGKLISRPAMTEKLLCKPPFRFLHDTVSEISRVTGFGQGLFGPDLIDSSLIKDKASKIEYLERAIKLVGMQLNTLVDARPGKIVAGLEPENTNRFLQLFALAAKELPNSSEVVGMIIGSDTHYQGPVQSDGNLVQHTTPQEKLDQKVSKEQGSSESAFKDPAPNIVIVPNVAEEKTEPLAMLAQTRSMRPILARAAPPILKEIVELNVIDTPSSKGQIKKVNIMMENERKEDSDEDIGIQMDRTTLDQVGTIQFGSEKGHTTIVREIIEEQVAEAKKMELVKVSEEVMECKEGGGIRLGKLKRLGETRNSLSSANTINQGKLYSEEDIEKLRSSIQKISHNIRPLGKCMDIMYEDLSVMDTEMRRWKTEYEANFKQLSIEREETEIQLKPLLDQLNDLNEKKMEQEQLINKLKATIFRNDERIRERLNAVMKC